MCMDTHYGRIVQSENSLWPKVTGPLLWKLTVSYGRALQADVIKAWGGKPENMATGQRAFSHRARMNALAAPGQWEAALEKAD